MVFSIEDQSVRAGHLRGSSEMTLDRTLHFQHAQVYLKGRGPFTVLKVTSPSTFVTYDDAASLDTVVCAIPGQVLVVISDQGGLAMRAPFEVRYFICLNTIEPDLIFPSGAATQDDQEIVAVVHGPEGRLCSDPKKGLHGGRKTVRVLQVGQDLPRGPCFWGDR